MPNLSDAQITGIVTLGMILIAAVTVNNIEQSYYCASEDNVKECLRVSSSGITCYYLAAEDLTKGDRCTGGTWEPLESYVSKKPVVVTKETGKPFTVTDDCIIKGKYCYCNPRGNLDNKRLC